MTTPCETGTNRMISDEITQYLRSLRKNCHIFHNHKACRCNKGFPSTLELSQVLHSRKGVMVEIQKIIPVG